MSKKSTLRYSVITPSRGDRPKALQQAVDSVEEARKKAGLAATEIEFLIGFDGPGAIHVPVPSYGRCYDFPHDGNYGNALRNAMLKAAKGHFVIFVDDDNTLTPEAFRIYNAFPEAELIIARIDTSRTLDVPFLPRLDSGKEIVRQTNVDPLCICATRDLVVVRCGGWRSEGAYESDYLNLLRYARRARPIAVTPEVVGIYDAGIGMDNTQLSPHQKLRLDNTLDERVFSSS